MDVRAPLEVQLRSRVPGRTLVELGAVVVLVGAAWAVGVVPVWLGAVAAGVFSILLVVGLLCGRRASDGRPAVRLDLAGVTVVGAPTVPWSDLEAVVVGPLRPRWLVGVRQLPIVSFLPRAGVRLPGPPQASGRPLQWARRVRERLYGTNLLLSASVLSAGADEIAAAAHDLGGLPVRRERFRGLLDWGIALLSAVVLGALVALVTILLD